MAADVGTGTTVTFGTSTTFDAEITSITINGEEVAVIDITHMGTTGTRAKMFGDLKENVTIDIDIHHDPDETVPTGVSQSITLTTPIPAGKTDGATIVGTGGVVSSSATIPLEDKMTGSYRIQYTGAVTRTASAA